MTSETTRIPHDGGENPVREGETLTRLWYRAGGESGRRYVGDGSVIDWSQSGKGMDIIAYAVTPERAPSPPAKAPTMDAVEAVTDAQGLAALRDEMVAAIRDIRAEKGFAGGTEYFGGHDLNQWEREVIADRLLSIVTREANFAGDRALAAARPFIAAVWQPIETAPKDGSPLLAGRFVPGCKYDGFIAVDSYATPQQMRGWTGFGKFHEYHWPATHWAPLPAPPTAIEEAIR